MKIILFLLACFDAFQILSAQNKNTWTWESGEITAYQTGIYGAKGIALAANHPGERSAAVSWKEASGDLWLFGGQRYASTSLAPGLFLNDLWKFNTGNHLWTWVSGDNTPNQPGVYGTKGIAAPFNKPGARQSAITWQDAAGNLWLYGGIRTDNANFRNTVYFDDLWKYEPLANQWTWVSGSTASSNKSNHGTKGIASTANTPGARWSALSSADAAGNLWLFGGTGFAANGLGVENDVWKYNPGSNLWTWISGDSIVALSGNNTSVVSVYGTKGVADVANTPGAREGATGCTDPTGNFWLFGGVRTITAANTVNVFYSDLWKFDILSNTWTWISGDSTVNTTINYGTKGVAATGNTPGARAFAQSWTDSAGGLWLFGGIPQVQGKGNDLWKYDKMANRWTWLKGDSSLDAPGFFGMKGTASDAAKPAARSGTVSWNDAAGNFWLFGGSGKPRWGGDHNFNDLWKFNVGASQWMWAGGDSSFYPLSHYSTKGIPDPTNILGARGEATSWTDASGDLWLFGGEAYLFMYYRNMYNDLWKYEHLLRQWILVNGDTLVNQPGVYGTKGVPGTATQPGARKSAVSWTDQAGNLWLFGGKKILASGSLANLNDLWRFDLTTHQWTWVSGDSTAATSDAPLKGMYGSKGIASANNKPYPRSNALGWTDAAGNLWLFGGSCFGLYTDGTLNDLWKFNITSKQWAWIHGDSTVADYQHALPPVYGTKGVAGPANKPGSKEACTGWKDIAGNFWIYSGSGSIFSGSSASLNDLWKYDPAANAWTWVQGDIYLGGKALYGKKGVASMANQPGPRNEALSWTDKNGNCWMYGGSGVNDLWKLEPASAVWTWINGDSTAESKRVYGTIGIADTANTPGVRTSSAAWADGSGNMWLFGGFGLTESHFFGYMNDLWKFSPEDIALPLRFTAFSAVKHNEKVLLQWHTAEELNTNYYTIQRSANRIGYDSIGTITAQGTAMGASHAYRFDDLYPLTGNNYYRLKQVDRDGRYSFSGIQQIYYAPAAFSFFITQNPVDAQLTLSVHSAGEHLLQLLVSDAGGRLLYHEQQPVLPGNVLISMPCAKLKKGMYFLTVKTPASSLTKTFFKN